MLTTLARIITFIGVLVSPSPRKKFENVYWRMKKGALSIRMPAYSTHRFLTSGAGPRRSTVHQLNSRMMRIQIPDASPR
jgi:hypothetical protein